MSGLFFSLLSDIKVHNLAMVWFRYCFYVIILHDMCSQKNKSKETKKLLLRKTVFKDNAKQFSELGMWLMAMDKFFIADNLPMSDEMRSKIASRNFLEEVRCLKTITIRIRILLSTILGEEKSSLLQFLTFIENNLMRHTDIGGYGKKHFNYDKMTDSFKMLYESMSDIGIIANALSGLGEIPYATFDALGSIVNRELFSNSEIKPLIDHSFVPEYDRVKNPVIVDIVKKIKEKKLRLRVAQFMLELFRLLRYLEYVDTDIESGGEPKKYSLFIFTLINSEAKSLMKYASNEIIKDIKDREELADSVDATIFSMAMELKKVYRIELIDILSLDEPSLIYAKLENSKGILKECFQQSIVQVAKYFKSDLLGRDIFEGYTNRLEQSKILLNSLTKLIGQIVSFRDGRTKDECLYSCIQVFKETSLKYLMFKDWQVFEQFQKSIASTDDIGNLNTLLSDFETYLEALTKEVKKRSVLQEGNN